MSALGQKQTCAAQQAMSALHPIATTKADISGVLTIRRDVRRDKLAGSVPIIASWEILRRLASNVRATAFTFARAIDRVRISQIKFRATGRTRSRRDSDFRFERANFSPFPA